MMGGVADEIEDFLARGKLNCAPQYSIFCRALQLQGVTSSHSVMSVQLSIHSRIALWKMISGQLGQFLATFILGGGKHIFFLQKFFSANFFFLFQHKCFHFCFFGISRCFITILSTQKKCPKILVQSKLWVKQGRTHCYEAF